MRRLLPLALALASTLALAGLPQPAVSPAVQAVAADPPHPISLETAPRDASRLPVAAASRALLRDLAAWNTDRPGFRGHMALDRPLYRPGDTVSLRLWRLAARGLAPASGQATVELIDPRGTAVATQYLAIRDGGAAASFPLGEDVAGGSWRLRIAQPGQPLLEREFAVATFQAPKIEKTLAFARDGYAPGERASARLTLERATGERLADTAVTARIQIDGEPLDPIAIRTDDNGAATISFVLPADIQEEAMLTVLVDDGGVTESISRPVPVALDEVRLSWFPEGGALVTGLPSRVYFEATDAHGEPVDVSGALLDDRGREVASFESLLDGRGRVTFTPEAGRRYTGRIVRAGRTVEIPLPDASRDGCVLHHHDDLDGAQRAVRVSVACSTERTVSILASQQEQVLDHALVRVRARRPTTVHLRSGQSALDGAAGVARVTVFDASMAPLAERLVYRNRTRGLRVQIASDRERYAPGDEVSLEVRTTDPDGRAVPADLSLAVVDDALLAYADDDEHQLASRVLLAADLPEPVEDVSHLFAPDAEDAGLGLDLVLGTRGWRWFDWGSVQGYDARRVRQGDDARRARIDSTSVGRVLTKEFLARIPAGRTYQDAVQTVPDVVPGIPNMAGSYAAESPLDSAPVRRFAPPLPRAPEVRTDFRDTALWVPSVRTDAQGRAALSFRLPDAVTGFRVTAEGAGGGWIGRSESEIASVLPLSLDIRLPPALSAGDRLLLPVTVDNGRAAPASASLSVEASGPIRRGELQGALPLGAGERRTVFVPLTALPGRGEADLSLAVRAGEDADAVARQIPIVPRGFPVTWTASGVLDGRASHAFTVSDPVPGSLVGHVTLFPSVISELIEGMEGMVRTPGGCFEQTSSINYPNVLVLDLLDRAGRGGALAVERERVLEAGYDKLTGYQVGVGGFETWGSGPGKEALSAFGLLQFSDMARVFPVDERVIARDVAYLYQQRNGRGGYEVTGSSAHGYGTAPPEVLDAYITWALVETGHRDLGPEIEQSARLARSSTDPYRLALATLAMLAVRPEEGRAAAARLAGLAARDGSFPGSETSITRSENQNLLVEATSLAAIALLRAGDRATALRAVQWIHGQQTRAGVWGATQGNALALKAIAALQETAAVASGELAVLVDGEPVASGTLSADRDGPLVLDLGAALSPGEHTVTLTLGEGTLPYALEIGWTSELPPSAPDRRLDLTTALARSRAGLGETVRLTAKLSNRTAEVVPDPIARIGLPAGLVPQTWQLEGAVDRGEIAAFETRPREVTLYWHGIARQEVHEIALDLVAEVPGAFQGPASSAYPYYDDQAKAWVAGLDVDITP